MSDNIENIESLRFDGLESPSNIEKEVEEVEVIQPKKKQLSLKQLEHLNNIRVKALEKKREIKLQKIKNMKKKTKNRQLLKNLLNHKLYQKLKQKLNQK